jgi:hypothetical protein
MLTIAALASFLRAVPAFADPNGDLPAYAAGVAPSGEPDFEPAPGVSSAAPIDEYFGPLSLSPLGIRNRISRIMMLNSERADPIEATQDMAQVEECVRDWEAKYPADWWLPRTILALHRGYRKIDTPESTRRSIDTASWLIARYPETVQAQIVRDEIARAVTAFGSVPGTYGMTVQLDSRQ